jgi:hypothetical protein
MTATIPPAPETEPLKGSSDEAMALFAAADTPPERRRAALTALITAKLLPKLADDAAVRGWPLTLA